MRAVLHSARLSRHVAARRAFCTKTDKVSTEVRDTAPSRLPDELRTELTKDAPFKKVDKAAPNLSRGINWRPLRFAAVFAFIGVSSVGTVQYIGHQQQKRLQSISKKESFGTPQLGGPWSLVDQWGNPLTSEDLKGKFALLYFGFSFCPDICPQEMEKVAKVAETVRRARLAKSREKNLVEFVRYSLQDVPVLGELVRLPEETAAQRAAANGEGAPAQSWRDMDCVPVFITVDPWRDCVAQNRDYISEFHPGTLALTGTPAMVKKMTRAFRVYYNESLRATDEDYLVDHSIIHYLVGPDGKFVDFFGRSVPENEMADRVLKYMDTHDAEKEEKRRKLRQGGS